ncbi:Zinc knuckle [Popillia japonica]|uniref:Zinc knuckle n=1 Tax=Popillia japonica TaxID=7064 RepID=A0AAW1K2W9_POPJA
MENVLDFCGLDKCIDNPCTEIVDSKLRKAKAHIVLSIDESLYAHIQSIGTASEIWNALKELYDNRGLTRQIGLLRKLITIRKSKYKKANFPQKKQITCYSCKQKGHIASKCPEKGNVNASKKPDKSDKCESRVAFNATYFSHENNLNSSDWYIDNGATHDVKCKVDVTVKVTGVGSTTLPLNGTEVEGVVVKKGVVGTRIISKFIIGGSDDKQCELSSGVYKIKSENASCMVANGPSLDLMTWHRPLGHINFADLRKMKNGIVNGMNLNHLNPIQFDS